MTAARPNPTTTLVIILGASGYPGCPQLTSAKAFFNSASRLRRYFLDENGFGLAEENLLDLFDSQDPHSLLSANISQFLKNKMRNTDREARDLIVYYCGHGGFSREGSDYFLALRGTRDTDEYFSSYPIKALATVLKEDGRTLRRYLILDSCFAAEAQKAFQSPALEVARRKTLAEFPMKGTALLCASGPRDPAKLLPNQEVTMFSGALLEILEKGAANAEETLSICDVGELVRSLIKEQFPDDAVRPEVHSPDQGHGDVSVLPLFPNNAKRTQQEAPDTLETLFHQAERGNIQAQHKLGMLYYKGEIIEKDLGEAVVWFGKAAQGGNSSSQNQLAWMYENGRGVTQNYGEALKWYREAAERGLADAQFNLGSMYQDGWGVAIVREFRKNYKEAIKWFKKAAEQENANALNSLGLIHQKGWGVRKNYGEAIKWFRQAADQGSAAGQYNLGFMYVKGWGVPRDQAEAAKWFRKSADQGYESAKAELRKMSIDALK